MILYNSSNTLTTDYKVGLSGEPVYNKSLKHTIGNKAIEQFDRKYYIYTSELRLDETDYNTLLEIQDDDLAIYLTPDYRLPQQTSITDIEVLVDHKITDTLASQGNLIYYIEITLREVLQN